MNRLSLKLCGAFLVVLVLVLGANGIPPAAAAGPGEKAFLDAKQLLEKADYDGAVKKLDEAIRLDPKQAKYRGLRGVARLRKGDYAQGAADLRAAIGQNPGDVGQRYQPSSSAKLSEAAMEHGRRQVAQMLHDRPAMAKHAKEAKFFSEWAARKFAGEDFGELIDWDPSLPLHSDAEHLAPGAGQRAAILLYPVYTCGPKEGEPRSFEELWAGAVYELHNVSYAREFVRLNDEAEQGKVSKEAFVAGILKFELLAAQRTRAFYVQVFLPLAEKHRWPTQPPLWFCDWWDTPESVLGSFTDKSAYPWRPYARTHDWATVHRHWRHQEFEKARKVLERMWDEDGYEEEQSAVSYWIGRCWVSLDKPTEAVAAFTKAIELNPHDVAAYRARGQQYEKLGEKSKAAADAAKARELEKEE